MRKRQ